MFNRSSCCSAPRAWRSAIVKWLSSTMRILLPGAYGAERAFAPSWARDPEGLAGWSEAGGREGRGSDGGESPADLEQVLNRLRGNGAARRQRCSVPTHVLIPSVAEEGHDHEPPPEAGARRKAGVDGNRPGGFIT